MALAVLSPKLGGFKPALPAKGKAAGIHIAISLAVFLALVYLIVFTWYPQPYFATDGGWQGIVIMFGVDVVLGPLLTFVVFNPAKRRREIVMDLSLVAMLQLSALAWGVHTVYTQRPVAIVEFDGTLHPVVAKAFEAQQLDLATLKQFDVRQPPIIFQRVPQGDDLLVAMKLIQGGAQWSAQTVFYARFDQNLPKVFDHAATYELRATRVNPALEARFRSMREKHGADVAFLPFNGRHGQAVMVFSRRGEIVDSFEI